MEGVIVLTCIHLGNINNYSLLYGTQEWKEMTRRGMFYLEDSGEILSTQYTLMITKPTSVWITVTPSPSQSTAAVTTPLDMSILVVKSKADRNGNALVTFTEKRDVSGVSYT